MVRSAARAAVRLADPLRPVRAGTRTFRREAATHRLAVRTAGPGPAIAPADGSADGPLRAPGAAAAVRP